jgi:hypothetical protein
MRACLAFKRHQIWEDEVADRGEQFGAGSLLLELKKTCQKAGLYLKGLGSL